MSFLLLDPRSLLQWDDTEVCSVDNVTWLLLIDHYKGIRTKSN